MRACVSRSHPSRKAIMAPASSPRSAKPFPWQPITRAIFGQYYFSDATSCVSHPSIVVAAAAVIFLCTRRSTKKIDLPTARQLPARKRRVTRPRDNWITVKIASGNGFDIQISVENCVLFLNARALLSQGYGFSVIEHNLIHPLVHPVFIRPIVIGSG